MEKTDDFYNEFVDSFQNVVKKPVRFLEADDDLCNTIKDNLKKIYDFAKKEEVNTVKSKALPQLVVDSFDLEQIWQQIELQNDSINEQYLRIVSKLLAGKKHLLFKNVQKTEEEAQEEDEEEENEDSNNESLGEELEEEEDESEAEDSPPNDDKKPEKNTRTSIVDDDFFKLNEMEKFLQNEEKKLNDPDSGNDSEDSEEESEGSVDLFEGESNDSDIDDARTAKYKDFFVSQEPKIKEGKNKFLEELDNDEPLSSFQMRQNRLSEKISEIEEEAIQEKSWQLKGEVTAEKRPQNSLLEEVVEFDLTTRPAPVITEQTTMQLEDIIKQRIKDKVFDSVERKTKPVETPLEYKKKLTLDQEKSKESLAQIYEREFIEQQSSLDPENTEKEEKEPELHKEINKMMSDLFVKLDALSNFHFTPKPAIPELKIISNLPAISMEEVAPVAVSDATLLAPEEIKKKPKSDMVGKTERTTTDRKRERRKKKLKQKIHAMEKQKTVGLGNKYGKEKMKKTLEKVVKEKNVDKMDESFGNSGIKSSKAFFQQLEDQVKTQIKRKTTEQVKKNPNNLSAKRLKL